MAEPDTLYLDVTLEGQDVAFAVPALLVEDGDRLIDKLTLVLADPDRPFTDFVREGLTVQVDLGWTSMHTVVFEGDVVRVQGFAGGDGGRYVTLVAFDPSYRMHREPRSANHEGALSAIVQAVAAPYGLPVGEVALTDDPAFTAARPLRQTAETDWAFLQRLAYEHGAYAFVEYNEGATRFYFVGADVLAGADPVGALAYRDGHGSLHSFSYTRAAVQADAQRRLTTVDPVTGAVVEAAGAEPEPEPPVTPDADHAAALGTLGTDHAAGYNAAAELGAAAARNPAEQRPVTVMAGAPSDPALQARALRADPTRQHGWTATGVAPGMPLLRAKANVELTGLGAWADGTWYVPRARHIVRNNAYLTQFVATR